MPTVQFVNTGPRNTRSVREHNLELSRVRSHAATVSHKARASKAFASTSTLAPKGTRIEDDGTLDLEAAFVEALLGVQKHISNQAQQRKKERLVLRRIRGFHNEYPILVPFVDTLSFLNQNITEDQRSRQFFFGKLSLNSCLSFLGMLRHVSAHCSLHRPPGYLNHSSDRTLERTAVEWSSWYDREFWTILVPQAAESHPTLKYAMVALGAYHESLEAHLANDRRTSCRALCERSGNKALNSLRLNYDNMSFAAILCCYVALTEFAAVLGQYAFLQALKSQFAIIEDLRNLQAQRQTQIAPRESDEHYIFNYLAPLMEKQKSRVGHIVDPIYLLRVTPAHHFYVPEVYIPKFFASLWQARQNLALLLDWTTYRMKTKCSNETRIPLESEVWLEQWSARLQEFRGSSTMSRPEYCSWRILASVAKVCFMMIENMFTEDEMGFDRYEAVYQEFASAASEVLTYEGSGTKIRFGVDSGLISLIGWMARIWCRDPTIRRQLIRLLLSVQRREGLESTPAWSSVCRWIQQEEESGIVPPPQRACDVPREKRLRLESAHFYFQKKLMVRRALRYPYDGSNTVESWVSSVPGFHDGPLQSPSAEDQSTPDLILGKGFSSFLKDGRMETIEVHRFTFPIPRT